MNGIPGEVFVRFVSGLVEERAGAEEPADDNGYHGGMVEQRIKNRTGTVSRTCGITMKCVANKDVITNN